MSKSISPEKIQQELIKLSKIANAHSVNDLRMILALERVIARVENHKKLSKHLVFKGDRDRTSWFLEVYVSNEKSHGKTCRHLDIYSNDYFWR